MDKQFLETTEYDFLRTNPHLNKNIILLGLGGSHAYGTNIETSDIDVRGVATRTAKDILCGRDFSEVVNEATDTTIYSLDRVLELLAQCNPNCIEMLGLRAQDYFTLTPAGELLIENHYLFLSKQSIKTFGGYATQQLYRLQQKTLAALTPEEYNDHIVKVINGMSDHLMTSWGIAGVRINAHGTQLTADIDSMKNIPLDAFYGLTNEIGNVIKEYTKNSTRNRKAMEHGKINKHAMHLLRLYMMAIDILEHGEIITYRANEHDLLMDIRNGKFTGADGLVNKDFFDLLRQYEEKFEHAKQVTKLPDKPDYNKIADLQLHINAGTMESVLSDIINAI